ncbi:PDDEXK family nuclease [Agromyces humi]|uniref:hypothetical protein n=1 Tax=Agromyces humi TaxID=1766800 RepID=UPI00135A9C0B|nr:hypothetical protein [Agromyces humi]
MAAPARSSAPRSPRYPIGTIVQSKNPVTSKLEISVRDELTKAGIRVHKGRSAIQCDFEPRRGNYPVITPDILLSGTKVCVEVDTSYTHGEKFEEDFIRNGLLEGAGWTVIRLRLGGLPQVGDHDILAEADGLSKAALEALLAAIDDAVNGRPGSARHIEKGPARERTKPISPLGSIARHKYVENAYYASWTTGSNVERFVIMAGGRYLAANRLDGSYGHGCRVPNFLTNLDLQDIPRTKWRPVVHAVIEDLTDYEPVSVFPWGDELFIGDEADKIIPMQKFNLGGTSDHTTANFTAPEGFNAFQVIGDGGKVLAELHPEAAAAGWKFLDVQGAKGYRGPYQHVFLTRD